MPSEGVLLASMAVFAALIALPALAAASRRRLMREASEVAVALSALAVVVRQNAACPPVDATLGQRVQRLRAPEVTTLLLAQELPRANPELLADTAQRLALRLKRRVAFERKMLARTASGRRRGAVAASIPPLVLLAMHVGGLRIPTAALLLVLAIETLGCVLLWRVARVEI
ncbi:MAG TPA: hypothetical protein VIV63_15810 [Steroidobacteraceae bacterium]